MIRFVGGCILLLFKPLIDLVPVNTENVTSVSSHQSTTYPLQHTQVTVTSTAAVNGEENFSQTEDCAKIITDGDSPGDNTNSQAPKVEINNVILYYRYTLYRAYFLRLPIHPMLKRKSRRKFSVFPPVSMILSHLPVMTSALPSQSLLRHIARSKMVVGGSTTEPCPS